MTPEEIFERQRSAEREYRHLSEAVAALLLRHNPDGDTDVYHNKYWGEAQEILAELRGCRSEGDVARTVHRVFVRWAHEEAGPLERYEEIGRELWTLWEQHAA